MLPITDLTANPPPHYATSSPNLANPPSPHPSRRIQLHGPSLRLPPRHTRRPLPRHGQLGNPPVALAAHLVDRGHRRRRSSRCRLALLSHVRVPLAGRLRGEGVLICVAGELGRARGGGRRVGIAVLAPPQEEEEADAEERGEGEADAQADAEGDAVGAGGGFGVWGGGRWCAGGGC